MLKFYKMTDLAVYSVILGIVYIALITVNSNSFTTELCRNVTDAFTISTPDIQHPACGMNTGKTTGGKGLHIVVPIQRRSSWEEAKEFCLTVANFMVAAAPDRYIAKMSKAARKGKIFVDYLRNDRGSTAIAPYSTRAREGAPVSVPLSWDELSEKIPPNYFNIHNLPPRLKRLKKDPWARIDSVKQAADGTDLVIFPGVEISMNEGFHLVALFDPSVNQKHVESFLGAINIKPDEYGKHEALCTISAYDVIKILVAF